MNLTRSTPIPSHSFPDEGEVRECEDCGAEWDITEYDDPPPWPCKRSQLKRSGRLERSTGPAPVSNTNSGREHQQDHDFRDFTRRSRSILSGRAPCDPAHVYSWGAGNGDWLEDGTSNLVPLTREEHRQLHRLGRETWEARHGIDLDDERKAHGRRYEASREPETHKHP